MINKAVTGIIRITVSFSLIGLLFFIMRRQLANILQLLLNVSIPLLAIALMSSLTGHFFIAMRLRLFLAAQQIKINIKEAIGLSLIGYFFNLFLPTAVGGDAVKAYYASKKTEGRLHSFTSVFMDRLIGSLALISLALFAFILISGEIRDKIIIWPVWVLFFAFITFLLMLFNTRVITKISSFKIFKWLEKIHFSLLALRGKKWLFLKTFSISIIAQLFGFMAAYFLIKGLHDFVPFIKILFIMPLIVTASLFPSINGLGVREGAFVVLFRPLIGAERAFALSLLWLFLYILVGILGGFVYAFAKHGKREILDTSNQ